MSILPHPIEHSLRQLKHLFGSHLLTGSCLLCQADSLDELLCQECMDELPRQDEWHCPQCADTSPHGQLCGQCLANKPHFDETIAPFRYEFPVDRIIQKLKYGHQLAIAPWLGKQLAIHAGLQHADIDVIMPMPLHPFRIRERGFNQSIEIARPISCHLARPMRLDTLLRTRPTPPQAQLSRKERQGNVRGAFECRDDLTDRAVLLVDDVMTSGATLNECARVLKLHGARRVMLAVAARALYRD